MRTQSDIKRIVSKPHYVGIMSGRIMGSVASGVLIALGIIGMICAVLTVPCLILMMISNEHRLSPLSLIMIVLIVIIFFLTSLQFMKIGWAGFKSVMQTEAIVPFTRQTALDIPAQDSLVRASSAESIADSTILLRPAAQTETASDELLRPHSGQ